MKTLTNYALYLIIVIFYSGSTWALTFAESTAKSNENFAYVNFGGSQGGFGLRGAYEYKYHRTFSIGGFIHAEPKDNDTGAPSVTSISAFVRPHFYQRTWNFYISPGFGLLMAKLGDESDTTVGPSLAIGILYQINDNLAAGIENLKLYGWSGEVTRGNVSDSLFVNLQWAFN